MSLIAELKRRKVFTVGAAYLVVGWLLIQVAATLAPQLNLPEWSPRLITFVILLGFPVAILLAWVVDLSPDGIRIERAPFGNKRIIATVVVMLALAIGWYWKERPALEAGGSNARSIAVLPFVNMSGDAKNEYFSDGISEEILNVLARTPELQVAARTSSFGFKGKTDDVPRIARELKVRMVLEGSVRQQGDRVRITAQLIDAQSGFHVWSQTYDRKLADIFAIQDEIAQSIGDELKVRVGGAGGPGVAGGTKSLAAHDNYLRGLALWQVRRDDQLWAAKGAFERALAADPAYAQAWGGLALLYAVLPDYTVRISFADAYARGREAAERALVLDPTLAEPYAALGNIETSLGHRETGVALLKRAIELRPSFATAHQWLGTGLMQAGEVAQGIESLQRAANLDPRSVIIANNLATVLLVAGRNVEAIAACKPTLEYAPDSTLCVNLIGFAYMADGKRDLARPYYDRWAANWGVGTDRQVAELFAALDGRSDRGALARRLAAWPNRSWNDPNSGNLFSNWDIPSLLMLLGEPEPALQYLSRPDADMTQAWGMLLPALDPVRCDPRFVSLVKKYSVTDSRAAKLCRRKS